MDIPIENEKEKSNIILNKLDTVNPIILPEIAEKEENIRKRKRKFKIITYSILGIIGTLIAVILIIQLVTYIQIQNKKTFEEIVPPIETPKDNVTENWISYDNPSVRVKFKYPTNTKLMENKNFENSLRNIEIIYTPNGIENTDEKNLVEGFIFRITPLDITKSNLNDVASVKRESFSIECGENVEISAIRPNIIDGMDARTFDVKNCKGDFNVTYTTKFGIYFEINQIYRGDVGFRQQYMNTTEEIMKTLSFYPEDLIVESSFKEFKSSSHDIKLTYPKELNTECCTVEASTPKAVNILTLGTKENEEKYAVLGIFVEARRSTNINKKLFSEYVQEQKELLISDYKIVNGGREPTLIEEQLKIGDMFATRFKGLSWKGNDVIFIDVPENDRYFYSMSVVNKLGQPFEDILKEIFKTVVFAEIK